MKTSLLRLTVAVGLCALGCIARAQGIGAAGVSPPINQIEAIESHLRQSRIQSKRELDEIANKKPKPYEYAKPAGNKPVPKQKKPETENEKPKSSTASVLK